MGISTSEYVEANFDGIVGGTYSFGGLSQGNVASARNAGQVSHPKTAALQALEKARMVRDLTGAPQYVLPPHERPFMPLLRNAGFTGTDDEVIASAVEEAPALVVSASSAAAMWAANAATVAPSIDTEDGKIHIVPAALGEMLHRSLEGPVTARILRMVFNERIAVVHDPLHLHPRLGDEGAANHSRFTGAHGEAGLHLFVYGQNPNDPNAPKPKKFPARQSLEASRAVSRLNQLDSSRVIFAQQNPKMIDAGVFHNDVTAVANRNVWLLHENSYVDTAGVIARIRDALDGDLITMIATRKEMSFADVEKSYLFNSQLIDLPDGSMAIIAPSEAQENERARKFLEKIKADPSNPVTQLVFVNVRESMRNGGGPACLRLRVVLSDAEITEISNTARVRLDDLLYDELVTWVKENYRDEMVKDDLRDPNLLREQREALDRLTQILKIGSVYDFQL